MFRKLRNRFLILHMGIVILLMLVFFCSIFIINYRDMENRSIRMIEEEGQMPPMMPRVFVSRGRPFGLIPTFSVELTENNQVLNVMSIFDLSEEFYSDITDEVVKKKDDAGKLAYKGAHFRYKKMPNRIVFLEITKDVDTLYNMTMSFLWIMLPMIAVIFFISLYFANKSIKPIEETFNKQREFIADASHELKTPLTTISANTELLLDMAGNEQKKWLSYIQTEAKRMENLTNSLLYLTKMEYNKNIEFAKVNFSDITENTLMTLEAVVFEKKLRLLQNIEKDIYIDGNSEQLKRLVVILLDNAIKYTNEEIRIELKKDQNEIRLSVFNTGEGISEEDLKRIWDRFYRTDKSREFVGGFGLGLSIAKAIVADCNGKIYAESKLNEWTRFTVLLPLIIKGKKASSTPQ